MSCPHQEAPTTFRATVLFPWPRLGSDEMLSRNRDKWKFSSRLRSLRVVFSARFVLEGGHG